MSSIGQILKLTFVSIVALVIIWFLFKAVAEQMHRDNKLNFVSGLMLVEIVVLVTLIMFDVQARYIYGFHAMVLVQNYTNFLCL